MVNNGTGILTNMTDGGEGTIGHKMGKRSEDTKKKISLANSGKNHYFYGQSHTEETKLKMSRSQTGRKHSQETKNKLSKCKRVTGKDHGRSKSIQTPFGLFDSLKLASDNCSIKETTLSYRARSNGFPKYYYV